MLRGLSLVLLIGFVFGTYSSIFVASPIMFWLTKDPMPRVVLDLRFNAN